MANVIRSRIGTMLLLVGFLLSFPAARTWAQCLGDCDGSGSVSAGDLTKLIMIINYCPCGSGVGGDPAGCAAIPDGPSGSGKQCTSADRNHNNCITAGELTGVIQDMLTFPGTGCPPVATPTNTPANTAVPTNTPVNTSTPTNTPANTLTPTNTQPANTSTPTKTNTPTNTTAPTATNTASAGPVCGNGITESGEQCDDGGTCVGGPNNGQKCPAGVASVPGGVSCGAGVCTPFGGDGCAANCTTEVSVAFNFTGAQCVGGANANQSCGFNMYCLGGTTPGKACISVPCGGTGVCTDECGLTNRSPTGTATNDGSKCKGLGICTAGDANKVGTFACPSSTDGKIPLSLIKTCSAGSKMNGGVICLTNTDCGTSGACTNPCSPTGTSGVCAHQSGAVLEGNKFGKILNIGPFSGTQDLMIGQALPGDTAKMIPVAIPAGSVHFAPVQVPGLACACPHGVAEPDVHGPGNSGSGVIGCSSAGVMNPNVDVSYDHNTTPPLTCVGGTNGGTACNPNEQCPGGICNPTLGACVGGANDSQNCTPNIDCTGVCVEGTNTGSTCHNDSDCNGPTYSCTSGGCNLGNGPGVCSGGTRAGLACGLNGDCGTGGTCSGQGQGGGGVCIGGTNVGKVCHNDTDCPGSICDSPDDTTGNCSLVDPAPPAGSGAAACLESKQKCFNGTTPGLACKTDTDCGANATCGNDCNNGSIHPGVCNSPTHLTFSGGASPMGSALIVTTTAIGVIALVDTGTCSTASVCMPLVFGNVTPPPACVVNADCTTGGATTCATAFCAALCAPSSPLPGSPCATDADCGGIASSCQQGAKYGIACSSANDPVCGASNTCQPFVPAKGFDGKPCTADDPPSSQGLPSTIPTTTGTARVNGVDVNNVAGTQDIGTLCSGKVFCFTSATGVPFNCTSLMSASPSVSHASLVSAFPQLDSTSTFDDVVTNRQTAK